MAYYIARTSLFILCLSGLSSASGMLSTSLSKALQEKRAQKSLMIRASLLNIFLSAMNGRTDEVATCLLRGDDINAKDDNGSSLLHVAYGEGKKKMVSYLLSKGADINSTDCFGMTLLHLAAFDGDLSMVVYLISKGALLNEQDGDGKTVLHAAIKGWKKHPQAGERYQKIIEKLILSGAVLHLVDRKKRTALSYAQAKDAQGVVDCLLLSEELKDQKENEGQENLL